MRIGLGIGLDFAKKRGSLVAPVATAATSVTGTSFVANWNTYDGATTYYLDVSTSPTFATFVLQNQAVSAPTTSYTVTGLTACTTYYYRVRAEGFAPTISVAPTLSPSGSQITGTVITCGTGTWSSQGSIFNYKWKRNGVDITGATSNTYTIQAIDAGTTITCDVQNQNAFGKSAYVGTSNSVSATAVDPDAQAFITAAGITNANIISAENEFFIARKNILPLNSSIASYHLVTDKSSNNDRLGQFKFNAYNPVDSNAAKRLTYTGTVTANTTGIQGNGVNGLCDTYINTLSDFSSTDFTIIYAINTNNSSGIDFGNNGGAGEGLWIATKFDDGNTYYAAYAAFQNKGNIISNTKAIYSFKRSGTTVTLKRNNVTLFTETISAIPRFNYSLYLFCRNSNGSGQFFSTKEYSFFEFINTALTAQQETDFYNALVAREAALGR